MDGASVPTVNKSVLSALHQPFWDRLATSNVVLVSGCGGGYDFFSGLPLFLALKKAGITCYFGNLAFTNLECATGKKYGTACVAVTADSTMTDYRGKPMDEGAIDYFPEYFMSKWFREHEKEEITIYTFDKSGVVQLRESYQAVVNELHIDTIILADGGTDSLMRGDEQELGTPTEDMMSMAAVNGLKNVKQKFLTNLGIGVDCFHGVSHHNWLENVAAIDKEGGFLGSFSLTRQMVEFQKLESAFAACQPTNSIVTSSVCSAVQGEFGNYHSKHTKNRTAGSRLYISPLMSQIWCFNLKEVCDRVQYMKKLEGTKNPGEVRAVIYKHYAQFINAKGQYSGPRPACKIEY